MPTLAATIAARRMVRCWPPPDPLALVLARCSALPRSTVAPRCQMSAQACPRCNAQRKPLPEVRSEGGLPAQLGVREGAGQLDRERPVRTDHAPAGVRELDDPERVRVSREQLLAQRARVESVARRIEHDGAASGVLGASLARGEARTYREPGTFAGRVDVTE